MNETKKDEIKEVILVKLKEILKQEDHLTINNDDDLRMIGLDSFKAIGLVVELEDYFTIAFDYQELLVENFSSIDLIAERVRAKLV